jgi:hypothetical protein
MKIEYDMRCTDCDHCAFKHWYSDNGKLWSGECQSCVYMDEIAFPYLICHQFKYNNLSYLECMYDRKKEEKVNERLRA